MREMLIQLEVDSTDRRWQERANCLGVDPDLFFPERGASTKEAKSVCGGCEVQPECLEYALRHGEKFGIWGGMSERERRRIRRQRALAAPRHRQRLTQPSASPGNARARGRDGPRSSTSSSMPGPRPELAEHRSSSARGTSPTSSTAATSAPRLRRARCTRRHAASMPVRSRSTRFIDTCACPRDASVKPSARTPASPPSRSRIDRARCARATSTSSVSSMQLIATSGRRAPTAVAPSAGCGRAGPKSGARVVKPSRRVCGRSRPSRVGVVVEEHGHRRASRPTTRRRHARVARDLRAVVGLGRARRTARRRAHRAAGARRRGRRARRRAATARGERPRSRRRIVAARAGEREHRAVVVGVGVHVEQRRRRTRAASACNARAVAAFRDVRDALEHRDQRTVAGLGSLAGDEARARAAAVRLFGRRRAAAASSTRSSSTRRAAEAPDSTRCGSPTTSSSTSRSTAGRPTGAAASIRS